MSNDLISRSALIEKATGNDIYGMVDELKRCPFCGCQPLINKHNNRYIDWYTVVCPVCRVTQMGNRYGNKCDAIEAWNTRKPMEKIKEKLQEISPLMKTGNFCGKRDEFGECENKECWECVVENAIEIVEKGGME